MAERTDPTILGNDVPIGRADQEGGTAETVTIRAEIRETRERMGDTIEEIGERLNPNRLKEQVKDNIRDATIGRVKTMAQNAADRVNETRLTITNTIRENPIPAALVGVGLGWLIYSARQQRAFGSGPEYGSRAERARRDLSARGYAEGTEFSGTYAETGAEFGGTERPGGVVENVKDKAGELADRAQDVAGTVTEKTRFQTRRVQEQFYENPLAIGSATLALGLAAGLAAPATRREAQLVGDARDRLVDRVRNVARETGEKVQQVTERVVDEMQTTGAGRQEGLVR